ncbi:MAG: hypothetical protein V2I33_22125, partial [Kangiellaceae bacterium]|nr:hypothetical protein [Kangiellaceae bacterium]
MNTFLLQTIKCFTLDFGSCIGIGLVGDDVVEFFETIEGDCKMVEFINKVSNDLSYSGLYNVTYNYYWHMSEINDEVLDIRTAFEKEEWFQLG